MLTHIWGLMSPDAGRTENQKHKQYKLVLKSSELDPSLLPRLLCFRSSRSWAMPMGVPRVVSEGLWGPTSGWHPAHLLQLFAFRAFGGLKTGVFCLWVERGSAAQGPVKPILPPVGLALPRGFRSCFSPGSWWRFCCERAWKSGCPYSSSHAEHVHPENQSQWEPTLAQGYYLGGK